jgi:hypothetical protein
MPPLHQGAGYFNQVVTVFLTTTIILGWNLKKPKQPFKQLPLNGALGRFLPKAYGRDH